MLSDTQIKRAMRDVATEATLNDGAAGKGGGSLRLRIRRGAGGVSATWLAWWQVNGKPTSKVMGRYPDVGLLAARDRFEAEFRATLRAGKNPRVAVVQTDRPTVERMFQAYADSMKAKGRESAGEVERMLLIGERSAAAHMGRTRLAASITDSDVVDWVATFYQRGHRGAADKARSYARSAFSWAKKSANDYTSEARQDWGIKANPAADVPRDAEAIKTRERALTAPELAALWGGLDDGDVAACVALLICCGQRVRETLRIDAEEIDLDARIWQMPREKTKTKQRAHKIPLTSQAVEVLRRLIAAHPTGPLFPARAGSKNARIHDASVNQWLGRWLALDSTDIAPFQTRDLRRTWKSRSHDAGIDRFTRDLIQQHAKQDTGSVAYDRADYSEQMRAAMDQWDKWLESNVVGKSLRKPE